MNRKNLEKLISQSLAIQEEDVFNQKNIGYMARILIQATVPHSDPHSSSFERTNGKLSIAITGHPKFGLPYGVYPRLLLAWLVTEAVKTKSPTLVLGRSLSEFMVELKLIPTGGRWGTIWRLRDQMCRLFSAAISYSYADENITSGIGFNIAREYQLWWHSKISEQPSLWESTVTLGLDFFKEIVDRPVPIDMRALTALKSSSMAIDLYCWLTYRMSYLKRETEIPWILLQSQFGAGYADTRQGKYEFKRKLTTQLKKVLVVYKDVNVYENKNGLVLMPSITHIKKINL